MQTLITVKKQTHVEKIHSPTIFHLPPSTHTQTLYTLLRIYTHSAASHRSAGEHWQVCSSQDCLPLNVRTILKAAAACRTAPSGAENQDNFIVIISLLLSPSLSLVEEEEEEKKEGQHEGEVR